MKGLVSGERITDFNNSESSANSVVETTDLQKPDSEGDSIRQLRLTNDDSFPITAFLNISFIGVSRLPSRRRRINVCCPPFLTITYRHICYKQPVALLMLLVLLGTDSQTVSGSTKAYIVLLMVLLLLPDE